MKRMFVGAAAVALALTTIAGTPPAHAEDEGVGAFTGTITYGGDGIPPDPACRETTFDISLTAVLDVEDGPRRFTGPVDIVGNGRSGVDDDFRMCEDRLHGAGVMWLTMTGTDLRGTTFHCEQLAGGWIRLEAFWGGSVRWTCTIDGVPFDELWINVLGSWAPTPPGGGTVTDATGALLTGVIEL